MNGIKPSLVPSSTLISRKEYHITCAATALGGVIWTLVFGLLLKHNPDGLAHTLLTFGYYLMLVGTPIVLASEFFARRAIARDERDRTDAAIYMFTREPPESFEYIFLVSQRQYRDYFTGPINTESGKNVCVARYPKDRPGERFAAELLAHVLRQLPDERRKLACTPELLGPCSEAVALLKKEGKQCPVFQLILVEQPITLTGTGPIEIN